MSIKKLEEITGIRFHNKGNNYRTGGRAYQIVPNSKIKAVLNELNSILSSKEESSTNGKSSNFRAWNTSPDRELGLLGEEFVLQLEQSKLKGTGFHPLKVKDGHGYDIKSWEIDGKEIHIEVKTTTGDLEDRIFWTRNEHFRSKKDKSYVIYRVYNFDRESKQGEIKIIKGSFLDAFDAHPTAFYGQFKEVLYNRRSH